MDYEIKSSPIGGVGIFAKQFIPKDSLIWKFSLNNSIKVYKTEAACRDYLNSLESEIMKYDWISHIYACGGCVNEVLDDGKYWNHSADPNTCSGVNGDVDSTYAKRDIEAGEVRLVHHITLYNIPSILHILYYIYVGVTIYINLFHG